MSRRSRCGWIASGRGSRRGTSCFRARRRRSRASMARLRMWSGSCRKLRRWGSTSCICRPFIPSGGRSARARRIRRSRSRAMWAARGRSGTGRWRRIRAIQTASRKMTAGTSRFIPSWGRTRISITWWRRRKAHGMEIALDIAFQCSPDHPWVTEHPDVVQHPAGWIDSVRRESAQEVPGYLSAEFRIAGLARRCGMSCIRCSSSGSSAA